MTRWCPPSPGILTLHYSRAFAAPIHHPISPPSPHETNQLTATLRIPRTQRGHQAQSQPMKLFFRRNDTVPHDQMVPTRPPEFPPALFACIRVHSRPHSPPLFPNSAHETNNLQPTPESADWVCYQWNQGGRSLPSRIHYDAIRQLEPSIKPPSPKSVSHPGHPKCKK